MTHPQKRTRAEERIAELDTSPQTLSAEIEHLREEPSASS